MTEVGDSGRVELTEAGASDQEAGPEPSAVSAQLVPEESGRLDPRAFGLELPEQPDEAIQLLLRELSNTRAEASTYLDDLRRVAADFDNYRKRTLRDQSGTVERASERVLVTLLPVLDSFDAALALEPETETEVNLLKGMRGTFQQLLDVLAKEGLEPIEALGADFDPEIHEAVAGPSGDGENLIVTQELRRGYRLRDKVLRAALVAVEHE